MNSEVLTREGQQLSEADIQNAFENDLFSVQFQPQISLAEEGKVLGAEAFVRLSHPEYGVLVPGVFLGLVESMGRMKALTSVVVEKVAQAWSIWKEQGFDLRMSTNIDQKLFEDPDLAETLSQALKKHDMPKRRLTLEISRSGSDFLNPQTCDQLTRLRTKGFRLSLDDFGTANAVEKQLNDLPVDEIKISRLIIDRIETEVSARDAVQRAMDMASKFGLRVVAMGIERLPQLQWLQNAGCDSGQGFFYGGPLASDHFVHQILLDSGTWTVSVEEPLHLLIVDDDDQHRDMLFDLFEGMYQVHEARTMEEARLVFSEHHPQLMVIDVKLPDGSGIDLCRELLSEEASGTTSALFVSGQDTVRNRLQAYEAGGTDFIAKPFHTNEMVAKVGRIASHLQRREQLAANVDEFQTVAQQSMREAAHYGDIVQFFKNLLGCQDEKSLARELFRVMNLKGLHASAQFINGNSVTSFDQTEGVCSPIEVNVFELLRHKGRLFDFGRRTIVNDQHVSFLIKNMPEDKAEHGRVRDYIAVMIEGLEARYRDILKSRTLRSVFQQLQGLAFEMAEAVSLDKQRQNEALEKFSLDLNMSFHALDMTEEQESHITRIIESMLRVKDENELQESTVRDKVNRVVEELSSALGELEESSGPGHDESDSSEAVELF